MARLVSRTTWVVGAALALSSCWVEIGDVAQPSAGGTGGGGTGGSAQGGTGAGGTAGGGTAGQDASTGGAPSGGAGGTLSCSACGAAACECVPKAPVGYRHVRVAKGAGPVPCPTQFPSESLVGTGAVDTGCGACGCGPGTGFSCGVKVQFYSDAACATPTTAQTATASACLTKAGLSYNSTLVVADGSCPPTVTVNAPKFETIATLCASEYEPVECAAGVACVAAAADPFDDVPCVLSDNPSITDCPSEYPVARTFATGFDDKRQCEGCTCTVDPNTVGCAGATGFVMPCTSACAGCGGGAGSGSTTCVPTGGGDVTVSGFSAPAMGNCVASGSATTKGTVTATGTRVVCCAS